MSEPDRIAEVAGAARRGALRMGADATADFIRRHKAQIVSMVETAVGKWLDGHDTPGPDAVLDPIVKSAMASAMPWIVDELAAAIDEIGEVAEE